MSPEREAHMRRVLAHGSAQRVSDDELAKLREQAEFMALDGRNGTGAWAKVVEIMKELQERRQQDDAKEST